MDREDIYYRAFTDYRKQTASESETLRKSIEKTDSGADGIEITTTECTIDEDWVIAIEEGLVHVEKAIGEERQFIRSNGEVLPIEKVKRVSKDSVEHLARHSNLITKKAEGEDLVPDHLYTVERLSDYAVYENRFLYMLLCYLRDFIGMRYDKILDLTNTYNGRLTINKSISMEKRKIAYEVRMSEERPDDPFLRQHNASKEVIDRIDMILREVLHCLSAPLMEQVAKAPKLKPPITKTNVLKMNKNFKGAMALYDFVAAYDKAGYTVERHTKRIAPFVADMGGEFAETIALTSFLTYEHGLGMETELKRLYEEEEERRKREAEERIKEKIRSLQRRVRESGLNSEEYMLLLERRNRELENDRVQLAEARKEIAELIREREELTGTIGRLNEKTAAQAEEIGRLNVKYDEGMAALKREHEARTKELEAAHTAEKASLRKEYAAEAAQLEAKAEKLRSQIFSEREESEKRLNVAREDYESRFAAANEEHKRTVDRLAAVSEDKEREIERLNGEYRRLSDEKALSDGRLNALRKEQGLFTDEDDFTSRRNFEELEHQYEVFSALFKEEWKKTKKRIRKEILSFGGRKTSEKQDGHSEGEENGRNSPDGQKD